MAVWTAWGDGWQEDETGATSSVCLVKGDLVMLEWYSKEWQVFLYPKSQMPHGEVERFHNQSSSAGWVPELPGVRGGLIPGAEPH